MTRPKRHLCVVGDSDTVGRYVFWAVCCPPPPYSRCTYTDSRTRASADPGLRLLNAAPTVCNPRAACVHAYDGAVVMRKNGVARAVWLTSAYRGSKFLTNWMDFFEENADLRYPNLADLYVDEQKGG